MQAYVSLGSRSPAERSAPIYPTRAYRQLGRPSVNRLESFLTPNTHRNSTVTLNHGNSFVTLNDNSSSFFSGPTSPISSVQSQFTPNSAFQQHQSYRQSKIIPHRASHPRIECRTQIVRETDPITGELLPPIKVSYSLQSPQQKPISKEFDRAYSEFERVRNELDNRFPLSSLRR